METDVREKAALAAMRRNLKRWLREWDTRNVLQDAVARGDPTLPGLPSWSDSNRVEVRTGSDQDLLSCVEAGQIRLLPRPGLGAGCGLGGLRPVYVVILEDRGNGIWLVAPFSGFASPAVPGEWLTGLRQVPLKVLSLWNARAVDAAAVARGWSCGSFPSGKVADALDVWRHATRGAPLEIVSANRIGPPLRHPLDPRHAYMQEESELLDVHLGAESAGSAGGLPIYEVAAPQYLRAAEERGKYGGKGDRGKA